MYEGGTTETKFTEMHIFPSGQATAIPEKSEISDFLTRNFKKI